MPHVVEMRRVLSVQHVAKEMATRMLSDFRYTNGVLFECHFKDNGSWTLSDLGAVIRYGQADLHTHGVIVSPKTY